MIRVVMLGRLGNNLFQYAVGRALALRHGVPLRMDGSWFNAEGWGQVSGLRQLGLKAELLRPCSVLWRGVRKVTGRHRWEWLGVPVLREKPTDHRFREEILRGPADCVLFGYFQSPLYFGGAEEALRDELRLDGLPWQAATRGMAERLAEVPSVAVHVRRGDYLCNELWQVCDEQYYRVAMARMRQEVAGARFVVFSDDPEWCRVHMAATDVEVCEMAEAEGDPLHDLYLMSSCRHHIIANSSYSWWGAWLGKKEGQRVLCPERWFRGSAIVAPVQEKLCKGWEIVGESAWHKDRGT